MMLFGVFLFIASCGIVHSDDSAIDEKILFPESQADPIDVNSRFLLPRFNRAAKPPPKNNTSHTKNTLKKLSPRFNNASRQRSRNAFSRPLKPLSRIRSQFKNAARPTLKQTFGRAHHSNDYSKSRDITLKRDRTFYRVYSGKNSTTGQWVTRHPPKNSNWAIRKLALHKGQNRATHIQKVVVPKGTRMRVSRAGRNFGQPGGAIQYKLMNRIPNSAFKKGAWLKGGLFSDFSKAVNNH